MASRGERDRANEREEKGVKSSKKRKYRSPKEMKFKTEPGDEEENAQVSSPHSTDAGKSKSGSKTFVKSEIGSEGNPQFKKPKFTVTKFPQREFCAAVKTSSNLCQHEHERGLPKRLAKLRKAIENISEDWDVIIRCDEISRVDSLHEQIGKRDKKISTLKDKVVIADALHKTLRKKDAIISELRDANGRLQGDFEQQAAKVKELKNLMKWMLDPETSARKWS